VLVDVEPVVFPEHGLVVRHRSASGSAEARPDSMETKSVAASIPPSIKIAPVIASKTSANKAFF
jgi:hypothetical protein